MQSVDGVSLPAQWKTDPVATLSARIAIVRVLTGAQGVQVKTGDRFRVIFFFTLHPIPAVCHQPAPAEFFFENRSRLAAMLICTASLLITGVNSRAQESLSDRPKLRILNAGPNPVEVFWLAPDGKRSSIGRIEPGKDRIIGTTLGHHFAIVDGGKETEVVSKVPVQAFRHDPDAKNGVPAFYTRVVYAQGYPICASAGVNPYALKEAAYLVDLMLAKRPDVREAMIASGSRLSILAHDEFTTDQPEWAWLADGPVAGFESIATKDYRDARARGMGGSSTDPFCSCAEENLLAYEGDPYAAECILIHELAHNIHLRGLVNVDPTFDPRVKAAYSAAMKAGLWKGKYAAVNHHEYFAEGVQSWFDDNREDDHDHNHVDTRAELVEYDPALAELCREVFGDTEMKYTKPGTRLTGHLDGYDPAKAPKFEWPGRLETAREAIRAAAANRSEEAKAKSPGVRFDPVEREIEGWKVHLDPALLEGEHREEGTRALTMLANHLQRIVILVPAGPLAKMRQCEIWIEWNHPTLTSMQYHPGRDWLVENGHDPRLTKKVHIPRARELLSREQMLKHPAVILHELAHAYHDQVLGFDHPEIVAAFARAQLIGGYQSVLDHKGGKVRHYALSNHKEYFAEGTEAYFYRNDFYPFVRAELKEHDPALHDLLETIWRDEIEP